MILATLMWLASATAPAAIARESGTHIAFVGELMSFKEVAPPCEPAPRPSGKVPADPKIQAQIDALRCLSLDQFYEARYRVLVPLAGKPPAAQIDVRMASHRGKPLFLELPHALLVVTFDKDGAWLQKYQGYNVFRIQGDDWATCGQEVSNVRPVPDARPLVFLEPIRDLRGEDAAQVDRWRAMPYLRIEGDKLHCLRGVPVDEYLDYLRDGVLEARGVVLEPAPAKP